MVITDQKFIFQILVNHYVKAGSEIDRIVVRNYNTIYLVHKRIDILTKVLSEILCYLVRGKERLVYSVLQNQCEL